MRSRFLRASFLRTSCLLSALAIATALLPQAQAAKVSAAAHSATASSGSSVHSWIAGVPLIPTKGTLAVQETFIWDGIERTAIIIYPERQTTTLAPAIVMLHYDQGTAPLMANLTAAGNLAATMGYWVILPQAIGNQWSDDPSNTTETTDDVGFLASMIQTVTGEYPIDPTRVSMTGFSNGGFMTETMICQRPDLIASAVAVAADLRIAEKNVCNPSRAVPTVIVMGTADPVVPYDGYLLTMLSAPATFNWWRGINGCNLNLAPLSTDLPITTDDGTSVTLQTDAICTSYGEVDFYTVYNGGHAWPGSTVDTNTYSGGTLGTRSMNLDTTTMVGQFASRWTNPLQAH